MRYFVALGSNLGDPLANLIEALRRMPGLVRASSIYVTSPVEMESGAAPVLNAVAEVSFGAGAHALWEELSRIEQDMGRERPYRNAPRTLDLDIILAEAGELNDKVLTIPHPRAAGRLFVLAPLAELDIGAARQVAGFDFDPAHLGDDDHLSHFEGQVAEVLLSARAVASRVWPRVSEEGSAVAQGE
ncbi:MAG: 2-amino-4-hydroxy-6-hydroxymethyldihydropteridine diphosphokinase [Actinomycetota bacterium]|nr:2-amino-4-hydroxy-6-hydroxymethyldihydropteridine diphosphokinase [Actinomycetota bacterium]